MPPRAKQNAAGNNGNAANNANNNANTASLDFSFTQLYRWATGRSGISTGGGAGGRGGPRYRSSTPGQSYFSITLLKTPFGNLRLTKRFSVWTSAVTFLVGILTFVAKQSGILGPGFERVLDLYVVRPVQELMGMGTTGKRGRGQGRAGDNDDVWDFSSSDDFPFPRKDYVYGLKVVKVYEREESSFTQGILMIDGDNIDVGNIDAREINGNVIESGTESEPVYYESTGLNKESRIQKGVLREKKKASSLLQTTGGTSATDTSGLDHFSLTPYLNPDHEFGEGLAYHKGFFWQFVWQNATIHQISPDLKERVNSFSTKGMFDYEDGWGLTSDDEYLYATDSGDKIYTLGVKYGESTTEVGKGGGDGDGHTGKVGSGKVVGERKVVTGVELINSQTISGKYKRKIMMVNELEYIAKDEVWGNVFGKDCIARFDPKTGQVFGWLLGINIRREWQGVLGGKADVFNGIMVRGLKGNLKGKEGRCSAAGGECGKPRVFVTGKLWGRIFEVELVPLPKQPSYNELKALCIPEKNVFRHKR